MSSASTKSGGGASLRREQEGDSEYLVAPVVAMVEGVYRYQTPSGPQTEFVPGEELTTRLNDWAGVPLTLGHPTDPKGNVVLSDAPGAVSTTVGEFRNPRANDDETKLKGDAWIHTDAVDEHPELRAYVDQIEQGRFGEVSTGYEPGRVVQNASTHDGQEYTHVQHDLQPDHVALLVGDDIGNCSAGDGCGVGRSNRSESVEFRANRVPTDAVTNADDNMKNGYKFPGHPEFRTNDPHEAVSAPGPTWYQYDPDFNASRANSGEKPLEDVERVAACTPLDEETLRDMDAKPFWKLRANCALDVNAPTGGAHTSDRSNRAGGGDDEFDVPVGGAFEQIAAEEQ